MKKFFLIIILASCILTIQAQDMKIYGYDPVEKEYTVYLGVLNADENSPESIWNTESIYGSIESTISLWNSNGIYGSPDGDYTPFNEDAKYPPKVFDDDNTFYGYFTIDIDNRKRCTYDLADIICKYHDKIVRDIKKWHDMIFE